MKNRKVKIKILFISDRPANIRLFADALRESGNSCRLQVVGPNSDSLAYLRHDHPYRNAPTPELIVFDLSSIGSQQLTTLDNIKNDERLQDLPMALLVGGDAERRLRNIYSHRRNCTILSPLQLDSFLLAMTDYESGRFLNSVKLLDSLGLLLVRAPDEYVESAAPEVAEAC